MKKRVALISLSTPTFNNVRAASALPYHLILGAKGCSQYEFEIWTYNLNHIDDNGIRESEMQLGVHIHLLAMPRWYCWMFRLHLVILRVLLRYPLLSYFKLNKDTIDAINSFKPDIVWIYGEELGGLSSHFMGKKRIVTMPDCESMYYYRLLSKHFATQNFYQILRYAYAYYQYRKMEKRNCIRDVKYHFVGKEDACFFHNINPDAYICYFRHPLYGYTEKNISFHAPKIKILIAGRNDIYMKEAVDELLAALCSSKAVREVQLPRYYVITFLGKGWDNGVKQLKAVGYEVNYIRFAPDYIKELQKHDVQITPISVGTGTKGKVLDAIANGLLEIGTQGALENIAVKSGISCVKYDHASSVVTILNDMWRSPAKYEAMAREGTIRVRALHDRELIARQLFSIESV